MVVKIIIKRKVAKDMESELLPLLIQLRNRATVQPGYISGETLRSVGDPNEFLVISTWQSQKHWDDWFSSEARAEIQSMIDVMLDEQVKCSIYQYSNPDSK